MPTIGKYATMMSSGPAKDSDISDAVVANLFSRNGVIIDAFKAYLKSTISQNVERDMQKEKDKNDVTTKFNIEKLHKAYLADDNINTNDPKNNKKLQNHYQNGLNVLLKAKMQCTVRFNMR